MKSVNREKINVEKKKVENRDPKKVNFPQLNN